MCFCLITNNSKLINRLGVVWAVSRTFEKVRIETSGVDLFYRKFCLCPGFISTSVFPIFK